MTLRCSLHRLSSATAKIANVVVATALFAAARTEAAAEYTHLRRVKLAASVEFPTEVLRKNARGPHTHRAVTSSVTHAAGHIVEVLYDAEESAQIRDPLSRRIVWVPKTKLAAARSEATVINEANFQSYIIPSVRPIRFPLRRHDGKLFGETAIPAGQEIRVTAAEPPYLRIETRELVGWVKSDALEQKTDRVLTALAGTPKPLQIAPVEEPASQDPAPPALIPFQTSKSHSYRPLVPLTITAEVLGRQKYPMPGQKDGFWSTEVSPMDLALAWGPFMKSGRIHARMGYRSARFRYSDALAQIYSGNFHMYVDDPEVRKKLVAVRAGDIVRLKGALIRLEHPRGKANPAESTITGAYCYTMLCQAIETLPLGLATSD